MGQEVRLYMSFKPTHKRFAMEGESDKVSYSDAIENLAAAIIYRAWADLLLSRKQEGETVSKANDNGIVYHQELIRFFFSEWFEFLVWGLGGKIEPDAFRQKLGLRREDYDANWLPYQVPAKHLGKRNPSTTNQVYARFLESVEDETE